MSLHLMDHYRFMARYNRCLNERLYAACEQLSDKKRQSDRGAFFASIHQTLTHLLWDDKLWLQRFASQNVKFAALLPEQLVPPAGAF